MPFNKQAEYQATLEHLVSMARDQGWKIYAWGRAKELDADKSGLFCGIAADLQRAMQPQKPGQDSEPESGHPSTTRHP